MQEKNNKLNKLNNEIYLDNAATTKVDKIVADEVYKTMTDFFGNPSSRYSKGIEAYNIISGAKKSVSKILNCNHENILFTSGGTESNNLAILGSLNLRVKNKNIITSTVEHPSVSENIKKLESLGFEINYVAPNKYGEIDPNDILKKINNNTVLVSVMHVNNETGNIYNIKEISKAIRHKNKNIIFHCDGVQAFGKLEVDLEDLDVDLYTFSGHKIHAPKGVGGLYFKKNIKLRPLIIGGHQENNLRAGTENVPGIAGLKKACDLLNINKNLEYINNLYKLLVTEISKLNNIHINSIGNISPFVFNFSILGQKSEVILNKLQEKNIFISNGSACSKGSKSKALAGMGILDKYIDSSIRVSLSKYNTTQDILEFINNIKLI
ncbi:MAG: cysteine desulfurase [Oscillospiraceae bacterium]|nr:cysteine desulfurase [Oscillospiraceae bacterium]